MRHKGCIFDLDGTLADSLESIAYNANRALEQFGFAPNPVENYKQYAGDGALTMIQRALLAVGDDVLANLEQVYAVYLAYFEKDCMYHVRPYPGICPLLRELKRREIKIAVLSNKPHERCVDVVNALFGAGYFDLVFGMTDERTKKPDPAGALAIAQAWNIAPQSCVYVGDTDTDMKTGQAAGMFTVGVTWGFREERELSAFSVQAIVDDPAGLLNFF